MNSEEFDNAYAAFLRDLRERVNAGLSTSPPARLFHYTDAHGLLGMLSTGKLWATNLRYMNDFTELDYAHDLIQQALRDKASAVPDGPIKRWVKELEKWFDPFRGWSEPYSFCFCESGDQLSQWRAYGARGAGYSLGFESTKIAHALKGPKSEIRMTRVIYKPGVQKRILREEIDKFHELAVKLDKTSELSPKQKDKILRRLLGDFTIAMAPRLYAFKDPAFQEEREWRAFDFRRDDELHDTRFRVVRDQIVPYLEFDLSKDERLPISSIIMGPQRSPGLEKNALKLLLEKQGYLDIEVDRSVIPIRF